MANLFLTQILPLRNKYHYESRLFIPKPSYPKWIFSELHSPYVTIVFQDEKQPQIDLLISSYYKELCSQLTVYKMYVVGKLLLGAQVRQSAT